MTCSSDFEVGGYRLTRQPWILFECFLQSEKRKLLKFPAGSCLFCLLKFPKTRQISLSFQLLLLKNRCPTPYVVFNARPCVCLPYPGPYYPINYVLIFPVTHFAGYVVK